MSLQPLYLSHTERAFVIEILTERHNVNTQKYAELKNIGNHGSALIHLQEAGTIAGVTRRLHELKEVA